MANSTFRQPISKCPDEPSDASTASVGGIGPGSSSGKSRTSLWYKWPADSHVHIYTVSFSKIDAIGAFVLDLYRLLTCNGIGCSIYAEMCEPALRGLIKPPAASLASAKEWDVVFFNFSIFDPNLSRISGWSCRKILYFHGITPPQLLDAHDPDCARLCKQGYEQLASASQFGKLMANSAVSARVMAAAENDINRRERGGAFDIDSRLRKISICPPMVGTDRFSGARTCPLQLPLKPVRLLHVGRLVPHKRIEDVIALFHAVQSAGAGKLSITSGQ